MLVMIALLVLYAWGTVGGSMPLNRQLIVPIIPAAAALITLLICIITYFKAPTNTLTRTLVVNYIAALTTVTTLVVLTDGIRSSFLALLVVMLSFSGYFLGVGIVSGLLALITVIGYALVVQAAGMSELLTAAVIMLISTLGGYLLWVRVENGQQASTTEDRAYSELASELSEVAGKSEVVINAITDGVLALNGQGVIQLINPAAQQLLGWTKHDAITLSYKSILKLLDTKNQPVTDANDPVSQAIATNKVIKNDSFSLETQTGKTFLASLSVSPVGQLGNGVIVVFRDITTEKSDERQRAEFISTASHEMRTPVASIEGYLGLALNPATATVDEKARDFITKAHESAQHLGRLFSDLLDVSKADDSRLKNDPRIVDVVPFIHDIVEGLTPKAVEKQLRVLYKPMPDNGAGTSARINPVFYANVDNDHLREIVQNLVENAIKYTLKGDVVVDVGGDNEHIVISIADTGVGIPREDQAHLFQKFYRVDTSDTREIGGTGLGLYLCRRLTETIGGRIWVESEYKKGSTFYVEIPRTSHDDAMHLIEQASIMAEQQVEAEAQQQAVVTSTISMPVAPGAPIVAMPAAVTSAPLVAPSADLAPSANILPQTTPQPLSSPVAQVLSTSASPLTPQVAMAAAPTVNIPAPAAMQMTPPVIPAQTPPNTPLSAIEANPSQYTSRPQALDVIVPTRPTQQ
jgi:PAS domain S-box-containing protein